MPAFCNRICFEDAAAHSVVIWKIVTRSGCKGEFLLCMGAGFGTAAVDYAVVSLFDHALAALWRSIRVMIIVSFVP